MIRQPLKGFRLVFMIQLTLCLGLGLVFAYGEWMPVNPGQEHLEVKVEKGDHMRTVIHRLAEQNALTSPLMFRLLATLRGDADRIKAGLYVFNGWVSTNQVLDGMISGRSQLVRFTIPEGRNLAEVADKLNEDGVGNGATFLALTHNPEFIQTLALPQGFPTHTLEGTILPDTYYFFPGVSEAERITHMVTAFKKRAWPLLVAQASQVKLSPYQALVLASVIEKETGQAAERPIISGVFHNRLHIRMPLASDPTVIYGIPNYNGNISRKDLKTPTPYNTYVIKGLPPTPITNPGLAAIQAALNPASVTYLFFVGKGDGTHYFSSDYKTHEKAVIKYQIEPYRKRKQAQHRQP